MEWDDKQTNTTPSMLRVHLVLGANAARGGGAPDFAATRIYSLPSSIMPAALQNGAAGGGIGSPGKPPGPAVKLPGMK